MIVQAATRKVIVPSRRFPRVAIGAGLLLAALACRAPSGSAPVASAPTTLPRDERLRIVAAEDFVAPFYENRRATIVGDTTWGTTGQPLFLDLGNGMSFRVSARRYQMYDGSPFEGVGIPPHVVVPLRAAALREGRDEALERAVALARGAQ